MPQDAEPRLTSLAHGGGCGCKLSPAVLAELLAQMPAGQWANLLVGTETGDDAAVYRLGDRQALVATTDFFTPVVDDPHDFGRIAAANALSDVYAMGGRPIFSLAVLGMPLGKLSTATVRRILEGGASICAEAGIPVAGGHSIDSAEPIYGLVALGLADPDRILRNSGARDGDVLILTKGLGTGVFSAALKKGELGEADYATMVEWATRLNRVGQDLPGLAAVHAVTDVTGFGLLGHALEMCRGSGLSATLRAVDVPVLPGAAALARRGIVTGAGARNRASHGDALYLATSVADWQAALLCDPQTSGGLLVAADPSGAAEVLRTIVEAGFSQAAIIGRMHEAEAGAHLLSVV